MKDMPVRRIPLTQGCVALIDADEFDREHTVEFPNGLVWRGRICEQSWAAKVKPHTTYAKASLGSSLELRLHRVVMDAKVGELIDHQDGNGLNNTRENLRRATHQGNSANSRSQRGSVSRFKGVGYHKQARKWEAFIRHEGKKQHLGLHDDEESAARAYDEMAIRLFGEFAKPNFPALPSPSEAIR
jgi:hypothetical protein